VILWLGATLVQAWGGGWRSSGSISRPVPACSGTSTWP